ncbi:hypothetical protein BDZ91DRAFT_845204 [Kalaharituber pfeilii]|nr:hypothetical protein BDZ91DRAFT_845204 [Kalaharituber pfeilii]
MSTRKLTGKNLTMPFAAATMAVLLYSYQHVAFTISKDTRTSIRAAKNNAAAHREADGGQISWQNQSLRQHGMLPTPSTHSGLAARGLDSVAGSVPREAGSEESAGPIGSVGRDNTEDKIRERASKGR